MQDRASDYQAVLSNRGDGKKTALIGFYLVFIYYEGSFNSRLGSKTEEILK